MNPRANSEHGICSHKFLTLLKYVFNSTQNWETDALQASLNGILIIVKFFISSTGTETKVAV